MVNASSWLRAATFVAALALGVRYWWLTLLALRAGWWLTAGLLQLLVLFAGSGSFWWLLRSFQLQMEQELLDQALVKYKYYSRYHHRTGSTQNGSYNAAVAASFSGSGNGSFSGGEYTSASPTACANGGCMTDAGFQLRVMKRLPISAHLRTSWSLPRELCEEIASFVQLAVRDYVSFWFQPISPNEDFPHDVKFLLADLLGAMASRLLEIDSSQALTMLAKSLELLRLHLGWFREAYAQLAEEYPSVFEGDENDVNLLKRQEYVTAFVQRSVFIHPGCVASSPTSVTSPQATTASNMGRKSSSDGAEAVYLRHVATQLLSQLKPQLGQQHDTNVFVSIAMNLLREVTAFKILKPLTEYAQPQFANEVVLACLGAIIDEKDGSGSLSPSSTSTTGSGSMMPTMSLNKLRLTSSFLYKASKRSSEQAEAAFQAVVDAVATAASSAAAGASEAAFEGDEWTESSNPFTFGSAVFAANSMGSTGEKKSASSLFAMEDRLGVAKAARMMNPRGLLPGGLLSHKSSSGEGGRMSTHIDELKTAKNNLGSSLNSSLGKVGRGVRQAGARLRTLNTHPMDQISAPQFSSGSLSSKSAARMIRKPGQLLQKAWKRNESGVGVSPVSPSASFDTGETTPLPDDVGGFRSRSNARTIESMNPLRSPADEEDGVSSRARAESDSAKMVTMRERVVLHLEKAVANYVKMHAERPEMRNSARSRELYELLSVVEDAFMLGYRHRDSKSTSSEEDADVDTGSDTPPGSPSGRTRRSSLPVNAEDILSLSPVASSERRSFGTEQGSGLEDDTEDDQYYWAYLAKDRAGEVDLNAHWIFVASRCPDCSSSETFVSTRGVQWVLAAMEKRRLGAFCTALDGHSEVTEQFYESYAVLRNAKLMVSVLKSLAQLDALQVSFDVPSLLGRASEIEQELGMSVSSPRRTRSLSSPQAAVRVLEKVWETERYVPMHGWVKASDKRVQDLPSSEWVWEDEWTLESGGNDTGESSDGESANTSWEYAKTFEDKFHAKEKKFDSVRRRRWIRRRRQLPPVLCLPCSPQSSSMTPAAIVNGLGKARMLKQRVDALKKEKMASGVALKRALLKRRSKSFDKERPDSPISDLTLSMLDCDVADAATAIADSSTKSTPSRRRTRVGIPSLRRGSSNNKSRKSSSGDVQPPLSGRSSLNEDAAPGYDEDAEDDENLCFRCLKSLSSGSGVGSCQNCHQRVCASCHEFFAFMVFPPPLETSKKARVCGNCYDRLVSKYKLRIEAHVGKYLIKEREREFPDLFGGGASSSNSNSNSNGNGSGLTVCTSPSSNAVSATSSDNASTTTNSDTNVNANANTNTNTNASVTSPTGSRAAASAKFEITVKVKDESAYAWSVVKSFHDFEVLEKQLHEKLKKQEKKFGAGCRACHWRGVDYMEVTAVNPSLKSLASPTLSYEKRLYVLEEFLQQLLACDTLCQSSVVQKFLLLANVSSKSPGSPSLSGWDAGDHAASLSMASSPSAGGPGSGNTGSGGSLLMENGKWRKGRWIAPDANSKETKMRVLQKIEVSLFSVMGELFELDGIGMVRRQIFSMTRSFIKAFLGASHFRMLERQFLSFTDPKKLSTWISDLRDFMFPDPSAELPAPRDTPLSAGEMQTLRKDTLEAILASFPSKALSLFGDTSCQNAALKLHEFLQHEIFVKNLLFSITDELLLHLFPDSSVFRPKKVAASAPVASPPPPTDVCTPTAAAMAMAALTPPSSPVSTAAAPAPAPTPAPAPAPVQKHTISI